MTMVCRACGANDASFGSLCSPCWSDRQAAECERAAAWERARFEASRIGRPRWRPAVRAGHGTGTEREARVRGSR
jgi:hypothetical protein